MDECSPLPPRHASSTFLSRMFLVFLARTEPASRSAKPACQSRKERETERRVSFSSRNEAVKRRRVWEAVKRGRDR